MPFFGLLLSIMMLAPAAQATPPQVTTPQSPAAQAIGAPLAPPVLATPQLATPQLATPASPRLSVRRDTPTAELPFWRKKPGLMAKIRNDRSIVVSVKKEDVGKAGLIRFTMAGAGAVSKPKDFAFQISQRYEKLKEVSSHFRTVEFDAGKGQLFVVTEALGYQARMILKLTPVTEDWRSELQWEVIWGHFKGMKGVIGYERIDDRRTEMSMTAKYEAKELPLPKILMGFALEVITQKVAERMRTFIEAQPVILSEP